MRIRALAPGDWPAVSAIYAEGIATNDATLEPSVPTWAVWDMGHRPDCRLVAVEPPGERAGDAGRASAGPGASRGDEDELVIGWTALSAYSLRDVYGGVAWESVYVAERARGRGVGRRLLEALIPASEAAGVWTLLAGIQLENVASLALHERVGFRRIGVQERVGRDPNGRWRDVVLMERRSAQVGT